MSTTQAYCANCAKKENKDPQHLIIPAKFFPKERIPPMEDVGLLRSIINLDTTMRHSMALYDYDHEPDIHNDTYTNVRLTRERIEKQIKEKVGPYTILEFGMFSALAKSEHVSMIQEILREIREDFFAEDRFFGKKVGLHDTIYGKKDEASHNCWIFLKQDFILFTSENAEQIVNFFLKNQQN